MEGVGSVSSQTSTWHDLIEAMVEELPNDLSNACWRIFEFIDTTCRRWISKEIWLPPCKHAPDSSLPDHVLLTSAIAYCLGRAKKLDGNLLRLAALSHQFPAGFRERIRDAIDLNEGQRQNLVLAWEIVRNQEEILEKSQSLSEFHMSEPETLFCRILFLAHLTASARLYNTHFKDAEDKEVPTIKNRADFEQHPLMKVLEKVALVYGGATKIKGYVFESARLPEVRGASGLFDRINSLDVPALWGDRNGISGEVEALAKAPECVIFASGGNFLALAPVDVASELADAVERRYTTETLTGNSAVVWEAFQLLELQYGRQPLDYWWDDFQQDMSQADRKQLLGAYYSYPSDLIPPSQEGCFYQRKAFGELVTVLASRMMRRRGGWGEEDGHRRYIPHYELLPYAVKCHSCDVRPAVVRDDKADKIYCEACARKRVIGQIAKRVSGVEWFTDAMTDWQPNVPGSWEGQFDDFLKEEHNAELKKAYFSRGAKRGLESMDDVTAARDLHEVAAGSNPKRYIGLIYADGNNVGARLAGLVTPAEYRQFSQKLFYATKEAVFRALAQHLQPVYVAGANKETRRESSAWVHPWEIITIGGDDLIVIVPGSKALEVALSIGETLEKLLGRSGSSPRYAHQRFQAYELKRGEADRLKCIEKKTDELDYKPDVSLSAGVVIAHETTPIFFLQELAEGLQKSAKTFLKKINRRCVQNRLPLYRSGTVDFMALKSMGMVASRLQAFRERAYKMEDGRWLTARPYTWVELGGLLEARRVIHKSKMGRSQIFRIRDFMMESKGSASINYLYAYARLDAHQREELTAAFHLAWHSLDNTPPWRSNPWDKRIETIWHDLVEIYDYIERE